MIVSARSVPTAIDIVTDGLSSLLHEPQLDKRYRRRIDMENNNGTTPRVLRMKDLPPKVGFQPSTIYELIADGKFPPPFKIVKGGRASDWLESTIDQWLQERSAGDA